MSHVRWVVLAERTGDPVRDNKARRFNTRMNKEPLSRIRFTTPQGWKRKRALVRAEIPNFIRLYVAVMESLIAKDRADG